MRNLEFGIADGATTFDYEQIEQSVREIESAGATFVAFGESLTAGGDPYLPLAVAGRVTDRLQLGTAVVTPGSRHPALLARTLLTLDHLTGGRAFLGIGTGLFMGPGRSRLQELEEYCIAIRELVSGREATYEGAKLHLQAAGEGADIPIWIAAEGPRSLQLAGRIADAVVVENGATPSIVTHVRKYVAMGAEAAGRTLDDIDIWYMTRIRVDDSTEAAFGAPGLAAYGASFAGEVWKVVRPDAGPAVDQLREKKGLVVSEDIAARLEAFNMDAVPEFFSPHNVELLDKHGLRDWIADTYFAFGARDDVTLRMQALVDAGATKFMVPNFVPRSPTDIADVLALIDPT